MKNKLIKILLALSMFSVIACGPGEKKSDKQEKVNISAFPSVWESEEKEIKGGVLKEALVSDSPFKGIFNHALYTDNNDWIILSKIIAPVFKIDGDFNITDQGLAKVKVDLEKKIINVKLRENLKWEDGQPLNIDDYIFTYEVLGHPDYTGVRYDDSLRLVEGIEEYKSGKAKTISGLEKISDTEINIHVKSMSPAITAGAGGLSSFIIPKHYLQHIPVKDLEKSDEVRVRPIGAGPYKIKQIIPGESVELVPNEHYYIKEEIPQVEKLIIKVLPTSSVISSMKSGEYHVYSGVSESLHKEYKDFENIVALGRPALYYSYLGFNLGKWDDKKRENIVNKDAKLYNVELRKALGYAVNIEAVTKHFYNDLRRRANSVIPPAFDKVYTSKDRIVYNPEKAKEMLDKLGYKDIDGDGFREDPNGKPFEIKLAFMAGGETAEPVSQQYIQDWKAVGVKVVLTGGRLIEFNSFYDKVQANDPEVDMFMAAWGIASDIDPSGLYSKTSKFNFSRISDEKNEELIRKISEEKGIEDPEYRLNAIREWEDYYMENVLGFLPMMFRYELKPINKSMKFYIFSWDDKDSAGKRDALVSTELMKAK